jgi:hypothetical protein
LSSRFTALLIVFDIITALVDYLDLLKYFHLCLPLGDDRNFALESYGLGSKCFDHTEKMWEERSCGQVTRLSLILVLYLHKISWNSGIFHEQNLILYRISQK